MYTVIEKFNDTSTKHIYEVGAVYPAEGKKLPGKGRLETLSTSKNKYDRPFIELVEQDEPPINDNPPENEDGGQDEPPINE